MTDELGDRMKAYEVGGTSHRLDPLLPICARIDGRAFSKLTRGCKKPFDDMLSGAMRATCAYLIEETHALIGYVQSDEISLVFQAREGGSVFFDGKAHKMNSVLASMAAVKFYSVYGGDKLPAFDCRVWSVPSRTEASNTLLWRALDAKKNAVSMACRAHNSARSMHKKGQADMIQMLADQSIDFHQQYDSRDRHGVFFRRVTKPRRIDDATWERIPDSKKPESRTVLRSSVEEVNAPFFLDVNDREAFIFGIDKTEA